MKHNKKRNTAFIYEALVKEFTKCVVENNSERKKKIILVLKEFFSKNTILHKELELYNILLETKNINHKVAEKLLHETKEAYHELAKASVFSAQSQFIAAINKGLGQEVWSNFVTNYKSMASVDAIFNPKTSIKKKVLFEQAIVDTMSEKSETAPIDTLQPLDTLAYGSFIKKFNNKYDSLLQEQKDLLTRYVTSFADDGFELRIYLNEELKRLKQSLDNSSESPNPPMVTQKIEEVVNYLEGFRKREFTEKDLNKILKTQELVCELTAND